jgi:transposase-like protein
MCGSQSVYLITTRKIYKCRECKKQFSVKVGTIFEDSPIGLDKWLPVVWLIANCKNGISSYEIARDIKVTQKSAWFMLQRIREAMHSGTFDTKLFGQIEVDETFIGGKARNMHSHKRAQKITGTGGKDKIAVLGILERGSSIDGSKIRVKVIRDTRKKTLQAEIRDHVLAGSAIFSDALRSYEGLDEFQHEVVDHAVEYVRGEVHTNGLENFWSLLKRSLKGTYVSCEPFRLHRYIGEQAFRYNNRKHLNDLERFTLVLGQATGRRLTYEHLTGKDKLLDRSNSQNPLA